MGERQGETTLYWFLLIHYTTGTARQTDAEAQAKSVCNLKQRLPENALTGFR